MAPGKLSPYICMTVDVCRVQAEVTQCRTKLAELVKETKDACVDTYDYFDDFSKMRERLREASDKNAALVLETTNLRMKSWQDEERVSQYCLECGAYRFQRWLGIFMHT